MAHIHDLEKYLENQGVLDPRVRELLDAALMEYDEREKQISKSKIDPLTELPKKVSFIEHIKLQSMDSGSRYGICLAVCDIDFFKAINDSYGHKDGDRAIKHVATILQRCCREYDYVARLHDRGDEFGIAFTRIRHPSDVDEVKNRIKNELVNCPFVADCGEVVTLSISIGITHCNFPTSVVADDAKLEAKIHEYLDLADKAMYAEKERTKQNLLTL